MRRRSLLLTLAITTVAVLGSLTACSGTSTPGDSNNDANAIVDPTGDLTGVTLTLWAAAASSQEAKQVIDGFEKATGATVKTVVVPDPYETNVQTKLATGATPDLMFWQPTNSQLSVIRGAETLQNLSGQPWESKLSENVASLGTIDGVRYAAPVTAPSTIGVYYNKKVFAQAGISGTPAGFDGLLDAANKIKATGVAPFFEVGGDKWPLQWTPVVMMADLTKAGDFWPALNKNENTWTDPAIVETITKYQSIITSGLVNADYKTATFADQGEALFDGKAGMAVQLGALLSAIQANHTTEEINSNIGFFPISPSGNIGTYVPDQTNSVVAPKTGDSKQEAAARQFLAYWLGPDYSDFVKDAKTVSIQTAVPSPATVPDAAVSSFEALKDSVGAYQVEAIVAPDLYLYLADMLYGKKTPQQVAEACEAQFKQLAAAQGAAGF